MKREFVLEKLLAFEKPLSETRRLLDAFGWDSEELVTLKKADIRRILAALLEGSIAKDELHEWAEIVEGREDIGYEDSASELIRQFIFEVANPDINGELNSQRVLSWIARLN